MSAPAEKLSPTEPGSAVRVKGAKTLDELIDDGLSKPKRKKARPRANKERFDQTRSEMRAMGESGEWGGANGYHLVALYEFLHREVYGVSPLELDAKTIPGAAGMAKRLVEKFFGGDYGEGASFVRWTWLGDFRERDRVTKAKREGREFRRMGWRLQFAASLVTDFKAARST